jgi:hypothetical protein
MKAFLSARAASGFLFCKGWVKVAGASYAFGVTRAQLLRHAAFFKGVKGIKPLTMNVFVGFEREMRFCVLYKLGTSSGRARSRSRVPRLVLQVF